MIARVFLLGLLGTVLLLGLLGTVLLLGTDAARLLPGDFPQPATHVPVEVVEAHERFEAHERGASALPEAATIRRATLPVDLEASRSRVLDAPAARPPEA